MKTVNYLFRLPSGHVCKRYLTVSLWSIFIFYYLSSCFLHLIISKLIFTGPVTTPFGIVVISQHMHTFGIASLFLLAVFIAIKLYTGRQRAVTLLYWCFWHITVYLTTCFLLFHPNEYIHYPQYAVLAILLALCIDPGRRMVPWGRILFWSTILGMLDEMNQYFFLCTAYGNYLDVNDMLMNLQGAQAGLLLFYGFRQLSLENSRPLALRGRLKAFVLRGEVLTVLTATALISILLYSGTLHITAPHSTPPGGVLSLHGIKTVFLERVPHSMGSWAWSPSGHAYYILRPLEGLVILYGLGFLYSTYTIWRFK